MKFKVTQSYRFWWPVVVKMPDQNKDNAGKVIEQTFAMQFIAMPQNELRAKYEAIAALPLDQRIDQETKMLMDACVNWDEQVVDTDDVAIKFSRDILEQLMQNSWLRIGVMNAYQEAMSGEEARLKN
jgi:hypothetical protein